jgi:beta-glucosidase/6-phospho-beta-glucosidase/beta-galactosidase
VLASALADGVDCRGWFHHTAIDGYEWTSGRRIPFGAVTGDREAKPSLAAMAEAITAS